MNARDRERITNAVDFWIRTKLGQQELSEATGRAQGGARAAVTGGRHLAGVNRLIVEELQDLGLTGLTRYTDRRATVPGYYRVSKSWDLLVLNDGTPVLAIEYKSMAGSEGKNLNNRADEVIGAAQDLKRAQEQGLVPATMLRGYVFLMEITPEAQKPVGVRTRIGVSDPAFRGASYLDRMAIMCERLRDDGLYDMTWVLGVTGSPIGFLEPRAAVGWDRFTMDLRRGLC